MPLKTYHDEQPTLNLTPMIDVLFLLIIFFMVGTKFTSEERNIDLQVPEVGSVANLSPAVEKKVISVFDDGTITLDQQPVSIVELTSELRDALAQHGGFGVTVRGDADGAFRNIAAVLGACRQAGVRDMAISVRLARQPRPVR